MADQNLPPNGANPPLPPIPAGATRFQVACTDAAGNTALLHLDALNHQAAMAGALAWLCNNPCEVRKVVLERMQQGIIPATNLPKIVRG